jgi:multiple sugar transport system ATP-binding protein
MAEIKLKNVTKRYGKIVAVDNINLRAKDKEFIALVGPSGCGKSTTLRMIAGLEGLSEGEVYIGDREVSTAPPRNRNIAMVFQNYALYPHMNVYKNMSFGLRLRKHPKEEIDRRVREAADMLGIGDLLTRKPKELSGGQRQRVAMGRAIVRKPQAFLFDEPLSNLDAKLRVQMRAELAGLHERLQTTIVYVTHDQIEAMTLATTIVIMKNGKIMQIGAPMDVYNKPQNLFVAGFIGSPAMNFLPCRISMENGKMFARDDNFSLPIPETHFNRFASAKGRDVILGIRPNNIDDRQTRQTYDGGEMLMGTVEVVEPVGPEKILRVKCGSNKITACVRPRSNATPHSEIELIVNMNRMHLFDKPSGEAF